MALRVRVHGNDTDRLVSQPVLLGSNASLSFYGKVSSGSGDARATLYNLSDSFAIQLTGCALNGSTQTQCYFDLSAYAGKVVMVGFYGDYYIYWYVSNVAFANSSNYTWSGYDGKFASGRGNWLTGFFCLRHSDSPKLAIRVSVL